MKKVVVVGACGHVGLPFSIVVANTGKYEVWGYDIDAQKISQLNVQRKMLYVEEGGQEALDKALQSGNLKFTPEMRHFVDADIICIMLGTPVDSENNPRLDDLFDFFDNELIPQLKKDTSKKEKLIILRSTVNPGTTHILQEKLRGLVADGTPYDQEYIHLVFAPERVAQGKGIVETPTLPQIIGADYFRSKAFGLAKEFFDTFVLPEYGCIRLSVLEAELAKLVTNMTRYVSFALANEFYMMADTFKRPDRDPRYAININAIIDAANYKYPRMNLPKPGPNVGGPCLFKDGRFLTAHIPYADLINTSFLINEGFPAYLFEKVRKQADKFEGVKTVAILGMTFKKDSDDIRNSLSFKMAKIAKQNGYKVVMHDPYWNDLRNTKDLHEAVDAAEVVILMTPHTKIIEQLNEKMKDRTPKGEREYRWLVDVWKCLEDTKDSDDGIVYESFAIGKP